MSCANRIFYKSVLTWSSRTWGSKEKEFQGERICVGGIYCLYAWTYIILWCTYVHDSKYLLLLHTAIVQSLSDLGYIAWIIDIHETTFGGCMLETQSTVCKHLKRALCMGWCNCQINIHVVGYMHMLRMRGNQLRRGVTWLWAELEFQLNRTGAWYVYTCRCLCLIASEW